MSNRDRVLSYLQSISPNDATNSEIVAHTGVKPHTQVFIITRALMNEGLIKGLQAGHEWRFSSRAKTHAPAVAPKKVPFSTSSKLVESSIASDVSLMMTTEEDAYCARIQKKDADLRSFLRDHALTIPPDAPAWFDYVNGLKDVLGNINNSVSFLATVLAKEYLGKRFGAHFDAAAKAQGAPGKDIDTVAGDGKTIHCEIKTTRPYQPGFGAQQKTEILKDLKKLSNSSADHKLMMVTDKDSFTGLTQLYFAAHAHSVEIVNLLTGDTFMHK